MLNEIAIQYYDRKSNNFNRKYMSKIQEYLKT